MGIQGVTLMVIQEYVHYLVDKYQKYKFSYCIVIYNFQ